MKFTVVGYSKCGPPVVVAEFSVSETAAEDKIIEAAKKAIGKSCLSSVQPGKLTLKVDRHRSGGGYVHILDYINFNYS